MGYFKDVIKGISWMGAFRVTTRLFSFVRIAILARILTPRQFGVYGIAALVLSFLEVLTETGVNTVLIQERKEIDKYISTAWFVSILRGVFLSSIVFVSAPIVASVFNSPDSLLIIRLISLVAFIRGFINPAVVKFQKDLKFNKKFLFSTSSLL